MAKKKKKGGKPPAGKLTIRQWLIEHKDEFDDREKLIKACMRSLRVSRPAVLPKLREVAPAASNSPRSKQGLGLSKADFMAQHDDLTAARRAIKKGLSELGGDQVVSDADFRRFCGGPQSGWKEAAEDFRENQFRCGGKVWWASKATVKQMIRDVRKATEV